MKHFQKVKVIICACMLLIGLFSAFALYKAFRPSAGLPYEVLSREKAEEYMSFETNYTLLDIRSRDVYEQAHIEGAICLPYDTLVETAFTYVPDKSMQIYVYSDQEELGGKACLKLTRMGYVSVALLTGFELADEKESTQTS